MPATKIVYFQDNDGTVPVLEWLNDLRRLQTKAFAGCVARIRLLAAEGNALRRPVADYLRDGIYELRVRQGRVHYRLLYFFHGSNVAILAHACTKEGEVPAADIDRAKYRKDIFIRDSDRHIYEEQANP